MANILIGLDSQIFVMFVSMLLAILIRLPTFSDLSFMHPWYLVVVVQFPYSLTHQ